MHERYTPLRYKQVSQHPLSEADCDIRRIVEVTGCDRPFGERREISFRRRLGRICSMTAQAHILINGVRVSDSNTYHDWGGFGTSVRSAVDEIRPRAQEMGPAVSFQVEVTILTETEDIVVDENGDKLTAPVPADWYLPSDYAPSQNVVVLSETADQADELLTLCENLVGSEKTAGLRVFLSRMTDESRQWRKEQSAPSKGEVADA